MRPESVIGPYRIADRLGAGGMGEVYRAFDERLGRQVALKLIPPGRRNTEQRERLRREARASARLNHPAVVQVYDILETAEADCIVMELVEGRTLAAIVQEGPLPLARALGLANEIASALAEAHARGIVHRDLKTENVIVTPAGRAKVLDFGLAKELGEEASLTAEGAVIGTCRSMSPEQAEGLPVDHRSDLFSLGVLLYEMVTGRSPFLASAPAATLNRVVNHRHRPARQRDAAVPADLSDLIDRLLEKRPDHRPEGAVEVLAAISAIEAGATPTAVAAPAQPTLVETPRATALPGSGERRQVTFLACDLVEPGGGPLDPEALVEALPRLLRLVAAEAERFGGQLAPASGQRLLAWFGYPRAHEDAARRAALAGLAIAAGRYQLGEIGAEAPAVRVGIHTGTVVLSRAGEAAAELALGPTPGLAAALCDLATPQAVLASEATRRLLGESCEHEPLGALAHPGIAGTVRACRLLADRGSSDRSDPSSSGVVTPLVARAQELQVLLDRWELTREGKGQVALLGGEAGIGKSRLVRELKARVAADGPLRLEARCSPFHGNSAFHPVVELLRALLGTPAGASADTSPATADADRLEAMLAEAGLPVAEAAPLLAALAGLPAGERWAPPALAPERQRQRTMEAVAALLLGVAERRPVLLLVEDLHWIDPSSLELLGLLVGQCASSRLFLLMTHRPAFEPPWRQPAALTRLTLGPMTAAQVEEMIDRVAGGAVLSRTLRAQVVARTDGVPLFVEELTKMVLESEAGSGVARRLEVPATLRDWLAARLDRLGTAREVAQMAAALGRDFSDELLRAVSPWSDDFLDEQLDRLVEAELLFRRGLPPRARYQFKHALIQDAAYDSLLRVQRQQVHRRIAEVLASRFPEIAERQPELLAHHLTEAGDGARAIEHWRRAGEQAVKASASSEALAHLGRGLELLASLPEGPLRDQAEIALQVPIGIATGVSVSYTSPAAHRAYARAWELCQRVEQSPQLFPVLRGLYVFHLTSGQPQRALEIAEQLLRLAEAAADPDLLLAGHQSIGFGALLAGELGRARDHLKRGLAFHDPGRRSGHVLPGGGAPPVESLANLSWVLWFLGLPEKAAERSREAIALAERIGHPFARGFALFFAAKLHLLRRDPAAVSAVARELLAYAEQAPGWAASGVYMGGWATAELGRPEEGVAAFRRGFDAWHGSGLRAGLPQIRAIEAEVLRRAGDLDGALAAAAAGIAALDDGQLLFEAELWRLRGELRQLRGEPGGAVETDLARALKTARRQGAKALELRAATSLAEHWAGSGRRAEARAVLEPVIGWFTEGFAEPDYVEARAALARL